MKPNCEVSDCKFCIRKKCTNAESITVMDSAGLFIVGCAYIKIMKKGKKGDSDIKSCDT